MKIFVQSVILSLVFAMLALGTQVAFCEAAQFLGWDVHEHEVCASEHSHEHEEEAPCQGDCEPELKEAQLSKSESVPSPPVTDIAFLPLLAIVPMAPIVGVLSIPGNSEPPDGLPAWNSRSFTGRFLV